MVDIYCQLKLMRNVLEQIEDNDKLEIDLENNTIKNITKNEKTYQIKPFSKIISEIVKAGGLFNYNI